MLKVQPITRNTMYRIILNKAFNSIAYNLNPLIKALLIPTLILIGLQFIQGMWKNIPYFLLDGLVTIGISITVHRIILLGKDSVGAWGHYAFTKREVSFMINIVLIGALSGVLFFVSKQIFPPAILIVSILLMFYLGRISLVFPAISTDTPYTFSEALNLSKDHKLLCFIVVILVPIVFAIVVIFVYSLILKFLASLIAPQIFYLMPIVSVAVSVVTISILSITYETLIQIQEEASSSKENIS